MKVCIVAESFLPQVNGVTNSVLRVLEHLKVQGHEALVVAPQGSVDEYLGFPVVHQTALHFRRHGDIRVGFPSPRLSKTLADFKPDVVHLASPFVLGGFAVRAAAVLKIPTVAVFQTDVAGFARAYGFGEAVHAAVWRYVAQLHRRVDRTLAPSSSSLEQFSKLGIPEVYLWRRGIDAARFRPDMRDHELRAAWAPDGRMIVGFVGRLAAEKRVSDLAAIANRDDIQLVVVGDGPERAALQRQLPRAIFTGMLGGTDLAHAIASLDTFVHTGPNETFCQSVQEALASGVPVIAVNQGGPVDLVQHGRTGLLIDTSDPVELNRAIDIMAQPGVMNGFANATRDSVIDRSWAAINDQLLGHYREVIDRYHEVVAA